jgi:peptide/nickel transport system ATP-binding protein
MSTLEFRGVTVQFGQGGHALRAVDCVDLLLPDGAVVGLVGESGSGKSTLAKAAVGLAPVSSGQILLDGAPVRHRGRGTRPIQMVFQDPYSSLDPRMSIGQSIAEALPNLRGRAARRTEVRRLLELVALDPDRSEYLPGSLSGGQRQRVALARALAGDPKVVIADEVTSALDVSVQGAVLNLIRRLHRELGLSMLFISHNLAVVRYVSDYIAVMYLGRVVEYGPAGTVLSDPQHPYTRSLLDSSPNLGETFLRTRDERLQADPSDPHDPPPGCRFHPRCPIGPLVLRGREICLTDDPSTGAADRPHRAACHFAGTGPTEQSAS